MIVFFLLPFVNYLAVITGSKDSSAVETGGGLSFWVWLAVIVTLMLSTVINMASSSEPACHSLYEGREADPILPRRVDSQSQ